MVIPFSSHRQPPAQNLFCCAEGASEVRPAISIKVRDSFVENFAANFAAAMIEYRHEHGASIATAS